MFKSSVRKVIQRNFIVEKFVMNSSKECEFKTKNLNVYNGGFKKLYKIRELSAQDAVHFESKRPCHMYRKSFDHTTPLSVYSDVHSGEKPFMCLICNESFKCKADLECHKFRHIKRKLHACTKCNKTYKSKSALVAHYLMHKGKSFACKVCNQQFFYKHALRIHHKIHTRPRYICKVCNRNFKTEKILGRHVCNKVYRCGNLKQNCSESNCPVHSDNYICVICQKTFEHQHEFMIHSNTHSVNKKIYLCHFCDITFHNKRDLHKHYKVHSGKGIFECDICGKYLISKLALKYHFLKHTTEAPYVCDICNKTFNVENALKKHYEFHNKNANYIFHSVEDDEKCDNCGMLFPSRKLLDVHYCYIRNTPYVCCLCSEHLISYKEFLAHHQHHLKEMC